MVTSRSVARALPLAGVALVLALPFAPPAAAQVPPGYYAPVDTTDAAALRATLHAVIDDHTRVPYTSGGTDTWDVLETAQSDPANGANVLDVYRNASYPKQGGGGANYNREHVWPNSYGFPDDTGSNYPYTDCHALRLCDITYNQVRDNALFGAGSPASDEYPTLANGGQGGGAGAYPGNSNWQEGTGSSAVFEVWSGRRGDVARAMLYLDVRYEGGTNGVSGANEPDLVLTDDLGPILASQTGQNESLAYMGRLSVLLQWHAEDPVDDFERDRNDAVFAHQGNRNPFVDHPEWVAVVFQGAALAPVLSVDVPSIDLVTGGTATFTLDAGAQHAGKLYFVAGSASGTSPGLAISPPLPLNYDNYMLQTIQNPNAIIAGSLAFLDAAGSSTATLTVPPGNFVHLAGAHLDHAYLVFDIPGTTLAIGASNAVGLDLVVNAPGGALVVNEVDYDQPSTDTAEFVELFNAGAGPVDLAGLELDLVNGATGAVYDTIALSAAGSSLAPGQFLVIGSSAVTAGLPVGTLSIDFANATNAIQNGAPDAIVLRDGVSVLDAVSYEGVVAGAVEGATGAPTDSGAGSIARLPDGADSDDNATDFVFTTTSTPGLPNVP